MSESTTVRFMAHVFTTLVFLIAVAGIAFVVGFILAQFIASMCS